MSRERNVGYVANAIDSTWAQAIEDNQPDTSTLPINPKYPEPHQVQIDFLKKALSGEFIRGVFLAGRRVGKTTVFAMLAVEAFKEGKRVLYATPTLDQIERFYYACKSYLAEDIKNGTLKLNVTKHLIERPNANENSPRIRAKTAFNSDTLRGDYGDLLLIDEYQLMKDDLDEVILPMLLDNNGSVYYGGTPVVARNNQLRQKFILAQERPERWATWQFPSHINPHLSKEALEEISRDLTGSQYKLEILAQFVDESDNALWSKDLINKTRVFKAPALVRIVTAIDPASWSGQTGITTAGICEDGHVYVLESKAGSAEPSEWGNEAVRQYDVFNSDIIVYERNQGGKMIPLAINVLDETIQCRDVLASKGKVSRAEPVELLYEKDEVHHVGFFHDLEDQMVTYEAGEPSPDLLDSLVWAVYELKLKKRKNKKPKAKVSTPKLW